MTMVIQLKDMNIVKSMFADDYRQIAKDVVGLLYGYVKVEVIYHARI
jgi:hypothetical protein